VGDPLQDLGAKIPQDGDFRQLEHDALRECHDLRPDLEQLLPQRY
jgi:hypothetical protein